MAEATRTLPTTRAELAAYIEQMNFSLGATRQEIEAFVRQAVDYGLCAVCVLPNMVPTARRLTAGSSTRVAAVVSFPLGADVVAVKAVEARSLCDMNVDEVDMVIDVAAARAGGWDAIAREVAAVRMSLSSGQILKAIIEVPLLTHDQALHAAVAAERGGAAIVKTSTDFKGLKLRDTTAEDIQGLREVLRADTGIEASGGIRAIGDAMAAIGAGATRLGSTSGVAIVEGFGS
jgi:deoxyribose-phosphate aldolase